MNLSYGFPERLKRLRKDILHLTQKDFAKEVGIEQTYVSRLESLKNTIPPSEMLVKFICSVYKVNLKWLLQGEGEPIIEPNLKAEEENSNSTKSIYLLKYKGLCEDTVSSFDRLLDKNEGAIYEQRYLITISELIRTLDNFTSEVIVIKQGEFEDKEKEPQFESSIEYYLGKIKRSLEDLINDING